MAANTQTCLPIEVVDMILRSAEASALPAAMRCNSWAGALACKALYRFVDYKLNPRQTITLLKTLTITQDSRTDRHARIPLPSTYVRTLRIDYVRHCVTANLLRLIQRALSTLTDLRDLNLEFSLRDSRFSLGWVLDGCAVSGARLERFSTSIRCDASLAAFLEAQPRIVELSLRGFQLTDPPSTFTLSPVALPRLASFRVVHAGTPVLAIVLSHRPVEAVGFTLFREDCYESLDTLALSAKPIKRLTVLSLDESEGTRPAQLVHALASRMPSLEALHIIILLASYSADDLMAAATPLQELQHLKYLTFMAGGGGCKGDAPGLDEERRVVNAWTKACPSLKTVILPKGQMWYEREGKWVCGMDDVDS